jgi:hypothetical protein
MGNAAFLLPLMATSPCNGTPPLIKKLSMIFWFILLVLVLVLLLDLFRGRERGRGRFGD